jgi:hypothetical protein
MPRKGSLPCRERIPTTVSTEEPMSDCRCQTLNVVSGDLAPTWCAATSSTGVDGMGRAVHVCPDTGTEWVEERDPTGYGDDVVVLRRRGR